MPADAKLVTQTLSPSLIPAPADLPSPEPETPTAPPVSTLLYFPQPQAAPATGGKPTDPPPPPRLANALPSTAPPVDEPYNLLEDMRQAQASAAGVKEKVALYQFPSYLATNIRRVLSRSRSGRGDWATALSCLLWRGIVRYSALPSTRALSSALQALDQDDALSAIPAEQVEMWRRTFRFSIPDPTHTMGLEKCRQWRAPEHVQVELHDLAGRIGMSGSVLGVVAVMVGLEDQQGVIPEHRAYMVATIAELDRLIGERERRLRKLVSAIEAGVWEP